jgi:hypothetical protein
MRDFVWLLAAIVIGICGFAVRERMFHRFGKSELGLLAGEVFGWTGYFLALAILVLRAEERWHAPGSSGALFFTFGSVVAVGTVSYLTALARRRSKGSGRRRSPKHR